MSEFNFESSVCTSIEQSKRLLALGLKKETADMVWLNLGKKKNVWTCKVCIDCTPVYVENRSIPAWSLHRLIKLAYGNWDEDIVPVYLGNSYDMLIGRIEFQVKQGKFNKEYLV